MLNILGFLNLLNWNKFVRNFHMCCRCAVSCSYCVTVRGRLVSFKRLHVLACNHVAHLTSTGEDFISITLPLNCSTHTHACSICLLMNLLIIEVFCPSLTFLLLAGTEISIQFAHPLISLKFPENWRCFSLQAIMASFYLQCFECFWFVVCVRLCNSFSYFTKPCSLLTRK